MILILESVKTHVFINQNYCEHWNRIYFKPIRSHNSIVTNGSNYESNHTVVVICELVIGRNICHWGSNPNSWTYYTIRGFWQTVVGYGLRFTQ